jgi:hypothetical protein
VIKASFAAGCQHQFARGSKKMEIAILIVLLIVIGSMIPAHHHIALLR